MSKSLKRTGQQPDETPADYLRRVVESVNYEQESLLDTLPTIEAVLDFFDLWAAYDVDFWSGVLECIAEGEDPAKAREFVKKHKLPKGWKQEIDESVKAYKAASTEMIGW